MYSIICALLRRRQPFMNHSFQLIIRYRFSYKIIASGLLRRFPVLLISKGTLSNDRNSGRQLPNDFRCLQSIQIRHFISIRIRSGFTSSNIVTTSIPSCARIIRCSLPKIASNKSKLLSVSSATKIQACRVFTALLIPPLVSSSFFFSESDWECC